MNPISCNELADFIEANPGFLNNVKPFLVDYSGEYMRPEEGVCLDHLNAKSVQEEKEIVRLLRSCGGFIPCFGWGDSLIGITETGLIFSFISKISRTEHGIVSQIRSETTALRLVEAMYKGDTGAGWKKAKATPFNLPSSQL